MATAACVEKKANICFDCQKACGGCSWTEIDPRTDKPRFEPVPGWTAIKTSVLMSAHRKKRYENTYQITACPEFVHDENRASAKGELTEEQLAILMQKWRRMGEL